MQLVLHNLTFSIFKCINIQSLFTPHSKNTVSPLQTSTVEYSLGEITNTCWGQDMSIVTRFEPCKA
jgi:hypothetical protein